MVLTLEALQHAGDVHDHGRVHDRYRRSGRVCEDGDTRVQHERRDDDVCELDMEQALGLEQELDVVDDLLPRL